MGSLCSAYSFIMQEDQPLEEDEKSDIAFSFSLALKLDEYPINKYLIVGSGLIYLPILIALIGKDVVFVDIEPKKNQEVFNRIENLKNLFRQKRGLLINPKIKTINSEFGLLDFKSYDLIENSFDIVTMIDLVGSPPVGNPKAWLIKSSQLLKKQGYLIIDLHPSQYSPKDFSGDTLLANFQIIFPNPIYIPKSNEIGGFKGNWNYTATNYLFFVKR